MLEKSGTIARAIGPYLGVIEDGDESETPRPWHPEWGVKYLGEDKRGVLKKYSASAEWSDRCLVVYASTESKAMDIAFVQLVDVYDSIRREQISIKEGLA